MWKWNVMVLLLLAGCSDENPSAPAPINSPSPTPAPTPTPTPTPVASSPYAGSWAYRTTIMAVDKNCGHTPADIGKAEGPFAVTVASNGAFDLPGGSTGAINAAGSVSLTLAPGSSGCPGSGSGAGGCRDTDHCDGTSEQSGDVKKWTLVRQ
jgi:hypothetical protein